MSGPHTRLVGARGLSSLALVFSTWLASAGTASALPTLQLYIEGATYNRTTESWELRTDQEVFRLWTIGNIRGPGGRGSITNVRLSATYDAPAVTPKIHLTPSTTGGYGGFTDLSLPGAPRLLQVRRDGSTPILGSGLPLPSHGEFGPGRHWQEFALGDFTRSDSPIADFIRGFPTKLSRNAGQINVYEVRVIANEPLSLHFDLYNGVAAATHASFAPFSHDATGAGANSVVPEPASIALFSLGALGASAVALRRKQRRAAADRK